MKMRRKFWTQVLAVAVLSFAAGCYSVKPVDRVALSDQMTEGSVVFVRADQFTMWFGSHSPRAYFEIVPRVLSNQDCRCTMKMKQGNDIGRSRTGGIRIEDHYFSRQKDGCGHGYFCL